MLPRRHECDRSPRTARPNRPRGRSRGSIPYRPGEGRLGELSKHPTICSGDMTIQRMDNVLIVVDDLEAAKAFFAELGMELEGEAPVEGRWVDRVVGLDDVRADIAMMRTPAGHSRLELTKFHTPPAVRPER